MILIHYIVPQTQISCPHIGHFSFSPFTKKIKKNIISELVKYFLFEKKKGDF